jgi:hypothetical protein
MEDQDSYYISSDTFLILEKIEENEYLVKDFSHNLKIAKNICEKNEILTYKSSFELFYSSIYNILYVNFKDLEYIDKIAKLSRDENVKSNNYCIFTIDNSTIRYLNVANKDIIELNLRSSRIKFLNYTYINCTFDNEIDLLINNNDRISDPLKKLYIVNAENFYDYLLISSKII